MDYHDWSLMKIEFDWGSGQLTIMLKGPSEVRVLKFLEVMDFDLTRKLEWGPSVSVNSVEIKTSDSGCECFVYIQSGDEVRIRAKEIIEA